MDDRRPALPALTGLRFLAALAVVLDHYARGILTPAPTLVRGIAASGFVGVDLFFVLSGFILCYRYADHQGALRGTASGFWRARFARIYPAYACALLLYLPLFGWPPVGTLPAVAALGAPLLLQSWTPSVALAWNPPAWSLSTEACFYACFPFLLRPFARLGVRGLCLLTLACCAMIVLPPLWYLHALPDGRAYTSESPWLLAQYTLPLSRLPEFVLGMIAGRVFGGLRRRRVSPLIAPGAALLLLGIMAFGPLIPFPLLSHGLLAPLCAVLIAALAANGGALGWALSRRPLLLLGEASYSLYLLQAPIWGWVCRAEGVDFATAHQMPSLIALFMALLVGASLLSLRLIELPARRALRARAPHPAAPLLAPGPVTPN